MRLLFCPLAIVALTFSFNSFADSPFPEVDGQSLILGVDDCSATKILNKAITESGVNPLNASKSPRSTWTCTCINNGSFLSGSCPGGTKDTEIEMNGCQKGDTMKCYSETSSQSPALCVKGPRVEKLKKHYGDAGEVIDKRARFDAVYVVRKGGDGYSNDKFWIMDSNGCEPTSAYFNNPVPGPDECKKKIGAYLNGGYVFSPDISKVKYCDGSIDQNKINAISELNDCVEAYPQLKNSTPFEKNTSPKPTAPAKKASATK